jgi:hypothetical protein
MTLSALASIAALLATTQDPTDPAKVRLDKPKKEQEERFVPWSFYGNLTGVFDSNINRDQENITSFGRIAGLSARYQSARKDPTYRFEYDIANHEYSRSSQYDRTSHRFYGEYFRELSDRLEIEVPVEVTFKGSTEDRDVSDQVQVAPELAYKVNRANKIKLRGVYRKRKFPDDPDRDAHNRYAQIGWERRISPATKAELSFRYETNSAQGSRNSYTRWTYGLEIDSKLDERNTLLFEARFRPRRYDNRFNDDDELRFDKNWIIDLGLRRRMTDRIEALLGYRVEFRTSNDEGRDFTEHVVSVGLSYRF